MNFPFEDFVDFPIFDIYKNCTQILKNRFEILKIQKFPRTFEMTKKPPLL